MMKMKKNKKSNDCKDQYTYTTCIYTYVTYFFIHSELEKTSADMYDPRQQVSE